VKVNAEQPERFGFELGPTARLELMAKLAEGTGLEVPAATANAISLSHQLLAAPAPPIATQCFLISNMFDPAVNDNASAGRAATWADEIRDDVVQECNKLGGVSHVYVDRLSPNGNVYVKCPSVAVATACVTAFHGRWFAGRVITVAYVPVAHYHQLFPEVVADSR
jgi:RNA-binding protein 39